MHLFVHFSQLIVFVDDGTLGDLYLGAWGVSKTGLRFNMVLMSFSCVQKCEFLQLSHKSRQTQPSSQAFHFSDFFLP